MKSYFPNAACLYHALLFIDMKLSGSCTLTLWPSSLVTRSICYIGLDDFRCKWPIKHQERKKKYCIGEYRKQFYSVESLNLLKYSLSLFILVSFRIFSSLAFRTFLQHELFFFWFPRLNAHLAQQMYRICFSITLCWKEPSFVPFSPRWNRVQFLRQLLSLQRPFRNDATISELAVASFFFFFFPHDTEI